MADADIFARLGTMSLPDAIDAYLFHIETLENPSGFERYAHRALQEIDMARLREVADAHAFGVGRIARMEGSFYLSFDRANMPHEDALLLLQAEAVLNRLERLKRKIGEKSPSEEACSVLDLRNFQRVTGAVSDILSRTGRWNRFCRPGTVRCAPGGEWDVRTRLAYLCEGIAPITHLEYSFDCDAAEGVVVLRFICPDASAMPRVACHEDDAEWHALDGAARCRMAEEHAYRVALVLAAAGFASGLRIGRVYVVGEQLRDGERAFALAFDRAEYLASFAPFAAVLTRTPLADMVCRHGCADHLLAPDELLPVFDEARRRPVRDDDRVLPSRLQDLLLATTVAELNVMEPDDDPAMLRYKRAKAALGTDREQGEGELVSLVSALEARCAAQELASTAPVQSQFCENALGRIILPLLEDDVQTRVHRAPDALFFAQAELVELYTARGWDEQALAESQKLLDMSGTSMQAHFLLINLLARLERFDEVVEVCKHGLRVAYEREAIAYLLYRLAFALWQTGQTGAALAAYAVVPTGTKVSSMASVELRMLMAEAQVERPPKQEDAAETLEAAGVPLPLTEELFNQVADAAVMLVDAGVFTAAQPCVGFLWRAFSIDELGVLLKSLQAR